MRNILLTVMLILLLPLGACAPSTLRLPDEVNHAIDNASDVTLYSLQPHGGPDLPEWNFHNHHILGKVELHKEKAQAAIAALNTAVSEGRADMMAMCLINPRHAIRVTASSDIYDILICYECGQLALYKNEKSLEFFGAIGGNDKALNRLLVEAGIPLADNPAALEHAYREETHVALERAKQGDTQAQEVVGKYYLSGRGIDKSINEGSKWLAKSYGLSIDSAKFKVKLGKLLYNSFGVKSDTPAAVKLFHEAANMGDAEGQYQYGYMYELGTGVTRNEAEALKWFKRAADQSNAKGQYRVGLTYVDNWRERTVSPDAKKWFFKAAEQGHPEAMHWLGAVYEEGLGVTKDVGESYFWYQLARKYNTYYGGPKQEVSSKKKVEAEKRISEWTATHTACPADCHD